MADYLIPIPSLQVSEAVELCGIELLPPAAASQLVRDSPPVTGWTTSVAEAIEFAGNGCIVRVSSAADATSALSATRAALDLLLLHQQRVIRDRATAFSIPGELATATVPFVVLTDRSAPGFTRMGPPQGFHFTPSSFEQIAQSENLQFLSSALQSPNTSEAARRASTGSRLLARAIRETEPDLKILGLVSALEAFLIDGSERFQKARLLAQRIAWLKCGNSGDGQCGRGKPSCPIVYLDPGRGKNATRLARLEAFGNSHPGWRCSDWHWALGLYATRSRIAHGGIDLVTARDADNALFVTCRELLDPILEVLRNNPLDPVHSLRQAISSAPINRQFKAQMEDLLFGDDEPTGPPKL